MFDKRLIYQVMDAEFILWNDMAKSAEIEILLKESN